MTEQQPSTADVRAASARTLLTIVIPCFNERNTVLEVIDRVKRLPIDKTVIVIDNCSTDGTRELLRSACQSAPSARDDRRADRPTRELMAGDGFTVVLQPRNERKGTSVKLGLALARSEYFVCQDADLEYHPEDLLRLLDHARSTGAVAVFGSRLAGGRGASHQNAIRMDSFQLGRVALTRLFQLLYQSSLSDVATCYKLMKTEAAQALDLQTSGFELDFEIPAKLRAKGYCIAELPIRFTPRGRAQGKKIRWQDGVTAVQVLLGIWARLQWQKVGALRRGAPAGAKAPFGPFPRTSTEFDSESEAA